MVTNAKKVSEKSKNVVLDETQDEQNEMNLNDYTPVDDKDEILTLDEIIKKFEEENKDTKFIDQDEFFDETAYLDLTDKDSILERIDKECIQQGDGYLARLLYEIVNAKL